MELKLNPATRPLLISFVRRLLQLLAGRRHGPTQMAVRTSAPLDVSLRRMLSFLLVSRPSVRPSAQRRRGGSV